MRRCLRRSPNKPICSTVSYRATEAVESWGGGVGGRTSLRSTRLSKRFHDCRAGIDALTREPFNQPVVKIKQLINSAVLKSMAALLPPPSLSLFFFPNTPHIAQSRLFFSVSLSLALYSRPRTSFYHRSHLRCRH